MCRVPQNLLVCWLTMDNEVLLYGAVLGPIWSCGVPLWGVVGKSSVAFIQRAQSGVLRSILGAPWYVCSDGVHKGLQVTRQPACGV